MPKKKEAKTKKSNYRKIYIVTAVAVFMTALIIGGAQHQLHQYKKTTPTHISKKMIFSTPAPTPTPDMSLQNTFRTYTNMLYGFSITYPALGENSSGALISCGNSIVETTTTHNLAVFPTIYLDSFYKITIIPWGAELGDFISQHILKTQEYSTILRNNYPGVDESALFYATKPNIGYFADTIALLKKGNLIFQLDVHKSQGLGCQMLFDPRGYNNKSLITNPSLVPLLFHQYQSWNEATSIHFGK